MNKVFGIGMFKTGTKSLAQALNVLGYRTLTKPWFILKDRYGKFDNWNRDIGNWNQFYEKIRKRALNYDAFSDAPWMFIYKKLDEWFPGSKFVLTLRISAKALAVSDSHQWGNKPNKPTIPMFIQRYNNHNKGVMNYFKKKGNLLVMCFERGDGWGELCKFLNNPIPDRPFPHVNKGRYRK